MHLSVSIIYSHFVLCTTLFTRRWSFWFHKRVRDLIPFSFIHLVGDKRSLDSVISLIPPLIFSYKNTYINNFNNNDNKHIERIRPNRASKVNIKAVHFKQNVYQNQFFYLLEILKIQMQSFGILHFYGCNVKMKNDETITH